MANPFPQEGPTVSKARQESGKSRASPDLDTPTDLPQAAVDKVSAATKKTLEDPAIRKRIEDTGSLIVANTPEQFAAQIAAEYEVFKKVVAQQKLTLE